jgi:hypothetical protein
MIPYVELPSPCKAANCDCKNFADSGRRRESGANVGQRLCTCGHIEGAHHGRRQKPNQGAGCVILLLLVGFIIVIGVVGVTTSRHKGSGKNDRTPEPSGASYEAIRDSYEDWYFTAQAYVGGSASLGDLEVASETAARDAGDYDGAQDATCSSAIDAYALEIDSYASSVGSGAVSEGYAETAQAGQHMEEACD